ncbi:YeeE/YedE family protein [Fontimonas sp. SYSU GA230001]|uniref:YeeE/YedE family protein n=1 Tax=Fontimonas sp. SYSU GA230001 TaxID=3142450 RepID=UPI0032B3E615
MNGRDVISLLSGTLFGVGLAVAGMTDPDKVKNFLDLAGTWDPSLSFVMGAALLVVTPGYRLVFRRPWPLYAERFQLPTATDLDARLIGGSAIFGIGWGLGGYCPGPAVTSLSTFSSGALLVFLAMAAGMLLHDLTLGQIERQKASASCPAVSG